MALLDLTKKEKDFVVNALNAYWFDAYTNLQRKDLGDIEKLCYQDQEKKAKELMNKLENQS